MVLCYGCWGEGVGMAGGWLSVRTWEAERPGRSSILSHAVSCARTRLDVSEEAGEVPDERANGGVSGCLFACEVRG